MYQTGRSVHTLKAPSTTRGSDPLRTPETPARNAQKAGAPDDSRYCHGAAGLRPRRDRERGDGTQNRFQTNFTRRCGARREVLSLFAAYTRRASSPGLDVTGEIPQRDLVKIVFAQFWLSHLGVRMTRQRRQSARQSIGELMLTVSTRGRWFRRCQRGCEVLRRRFAATGREGLWPSRR